MYSLDRPVSWNPFDSRHTRAGAPLRVAVPNQGTLLFRPFPSAGRVPRLSLSLSHYIHILLILSLLLFLQLNAGQASCLPICRFCSVRATSVSEHPIIGYFYVARASTSFSIDVVGIGLICLALRGWAKQF